MEMNSGEVSPGLSKLYNIPTPNEVADDRNSAKSSPRTPKSAHSRKSCEFWGNGTNAPVKDNPYSGTLDRISVGLVHELRPREWGIHFDWGPTFAVICCLFASGNSGLLYFALGGD